MYHQALFDIAKCDKVSRGTYIRYHGFFAVNEPFSCVKCQEKIDVVAPKLSTENVDPSLSFLLLCGSFLHHWDFLYSRRRLVSDHEKHWHLVYLAPGRYNTDLDIFFTADRQHRKYVISYLFPRHLTLRRRRRPKKQSVPVRAIIFPLLPLSTKKKVSLSGPCAL